MDAYPFQIYNNFINPFFAEVKLLPIIER
jgi:hypothetical protein